MTNNIGIWIVAGIIAVAIFSPSTFNSWTGKARDYIGLNNTEPASDTPDPTNYTTNTTPQTIRIASWNLQVFGVAKSSDDYVMDEIANTMENFDIISIQEIRDSTGTSILALQDRLPGGSEEWGLMVSERLGRTSTKEQYALFFRKDYIQAKSHEVLPDPSDHFEREPYLTEFEVDGWDFSIITNHLKPDNVDVEMVDLRILAQQQEGSVIVLGDLNADCAFWDEDEAHWWFWVIPNTADTTTSPTDCTYDRIILSEEAETHFTGNWGVVTEGITSEISDHYPIWFEMRI